MDIEKQLEVAAQSDHLVLIVLIALRTLDICSRSSNGTIYHFGSQILMKKLSLVLKYARINKLV